MLKGVVTTARFAQALTGVASHQQFTELHEVKHVALMHPGELLPELDGLFPHLRRDGKKIPFILSTRDHCFDEDDCIPHLALVQVADDLLEEPLLQLLLCPHVLSVPRY